MSSCSTPAASATWPSRKRSARWACSAVSKRGGRTPSTGFSAAWPKAAARPCFPKSPTSTWWSARKNSTAWPTTSMPSSAAKWRTNRPWMIFVSPSSTPRRKPVRRKPSATMPPSRRAPSSRSCRAATCAAPSASCPTRAAPNAAGASAALSAKCANWSDAAARKSRSSARSSTFTDATNFPKSRAAAHSCNCSRRCTKSKAWNASASLPPTRSVSARIS